MHVKAALLDVAMSEADKTEFVFDKPPTEIQLRISGEGYRLHPDPASDSPGGIVATNYRSMSIDELVSKLEAAAKGE